MEMTQATLTTREQAFFSEYTELLKKFDDMDGKFSLWRVHEHFDVDEAEVLYETSDVSARKSLVQVVKKTQLPEKAFVSQWVVLADGTIKPSTWCCDW